MTSRSFSLATKMWIAVGLTLMTLVGGMTATNLRNNAIMSRAQSALNAQSERIVLATRWLGLVQTNTSRNLAIIMSPGSSMGDLFKPMTVAASAQISELQKKLVEQADTPEEKAVLARLGEVRKVLIATSQKALAFKNAGDDAAAAQESRTTFQPAAENNLKVLQEFADLQVQLYAKLQGEFDQERASNNVMGALITAAVAMFMGVGAFFFIRQIRQPLKEAIGVSERIARGDLTGSIPSHRSDEFGELMAALGHMQAQLQHLVADVRVGTHSIELASREIALGNQDLSTRTEQTAASLQETASSLEHLTSTVRNSTHAASQANTLAGSAAEVAQRGGEVVGQVITTMDEINASSQKIADIIGVIDGIAFQTNILALNAAVEAARAGEQGRGFAVVASEVRSLAGRSAEAAKEIKSLINASVERVESGSRLVTDAGSTMQEIVRSVQRVSSIIGEISSSATEQSDELSQVNTAVTKLDQMTQQNAALVEQSAAAASNMSDQTSRLAQVVSTFKVGA